MPAETGSLEFRLPDGRVLRGAPGTTAGQLLQRWKPKEHTQFLAALVDGQPTDLSRPLERSATLSPLTFEDRQGRDIVQHSAAHVVAKALTEWIPAALPTVGPPTEDGFYYDFDMRPLTAADLPEIERRIQETVRAKEGFERLELDRAAALERVASNPHKRKYILETPEGAPISFYRTGKFLDLCRGPHVPDTSWLHGIHLLGFSGVTEGGSAEGAARQRIRGIAFPTREALEEYLKRRKAAEGRDHRTLGAQLELFTFTEEAPGFPFWLPDGMVVVAELERFVREHLARAGYSEVRTPLLFAQQVYETSGHWEHFRADMFLSAIDDRTFGVKPMNCPGSMLIFRSRARSYRELPLRLAEFAPIHRLESSGTIHGLTRAREFIQDDAHLFVTEDQIEAEVRVLLDWIREAFSTFQLTWSYELSTRPEKFLGEAAVWDRAEATLDRILKASGIDYKVSPGEGAFYGPKVDIHIKDSMGRSWQTGTIQLDYQMPLRFGLEYQGPDGKMHTPIVIHRTILGSWERFLGVLLEHCNGRLPPWLAPRQLRVLPVSERHASAAEELVRRLRAAGVRAEATDSTDTLSKRVREAELGRVPYVAVIGDREVETERVTLRIHGQKSPRVFERVELVEFLTEKIRSRAYEPG
jgi:threonyl-tRNA synthetase